MPIFIGGPLVSVSYIVSMTHLSDDVSKCLIKWDQCLFLFNFFVLFRMICVRCLIAICEKKFVNFWG